MSRSSVAEQAHLLLDLNRPGEALQILVAHLASNPDDPDCLVLTARAHLSADPRAEGAREALPPVRRAIELDPDDARAWGLLSNVQSRLGAHRQARRAARTAQRLAPDSVAAQVCVVNADVAAGRMTRSTRAAVAAILRLAPDSADSHFTAGYLAHRQGRNRTARRNYRAALSLDSQHRDARNNLALIDAGRGDLGRAVASFVGILSDDPNYVVALNNLRAVARLYLAVADLSIALVIVTAGSFFRSLNNSLKWISPGSEPPGVTFRALAAWVAIVAALAFVYTVRRRAGNYFSRFVRSLPAIGMPLVVWTIGLSMCIVVTVVAVFAGSLVAVRIYEITGALLAIGFIVGNFTIRAGR